MPIEVLQLKDKPESYDDCPSCGAYPFESFMRGTIQRSRKRFFFFGKERPYCAVICRHCKEIVDWESPNL
jgi:hypothetical protein